MSLLTYEQPWKLHSLLHDPFADLKGEDDFLRLPGVEIMHAAIFDALEHRSIQVVLADPGNGKTTDLRAVQAELESNQQAKALVISPTDSRQLTVNRVREDISDLAREAGLKVRRTNSKTITDNQIKTVLTRLREKQYYPDGIVIVVDNAHDITAAAVRGLRQLIESNFGMIQHICGLVFLAWPRFQGTVVPMQDVYNRATINYLPKLNPEQVQAYVIHRLKNAGAPDGFVTEDALEVLKTLAEDNGLSFLEVNNLMKSALAVSAKVGSTVIKPGHISLGDRSGKAEIAELYQQAGRPQLKQIKAEIQATGQDLDEGNISKIKNGKGDHLTERHHINVRDALRRIAIKRQQSQAEHSQTNTTVKGESPAGAEAGKAA